MFTSKKTSWKSPEKPRYNLLRQQDLGGNYPHRDDMWWSKDGRIGREISHIHTHTHTHTLYLVRTFSFHLLKTNTQTTSPKDKHTDSHTNETNSSAEHTVRNTISCYCVDLETHNNQRNTKTSLSTATLGVLSNLRQQSDGSCLHGHRYSTKK